MKKFLSISLVLCMVFALSVSLVSCSHKCEFAEEWSKDDTSHWHACTGEDCTEVADKADHTWDEGKVTTEATQEADGVKTFTCTVCSQTKTEPVVFTGLSEEEWNAAFESSLFENFKYTEEAAVNGSGVSVDTKTEYKFTKDSVWGKMTLAGQSQEETSSDAEEVAELRKQLVDSIIALAPYDSYKYDAETKSYKATKPVEIETLGTSTSDVTLKFADNKLVEIKYNVSFTQEGISFTATSTVTISDYGTVTK